MKNRIAILILLFVTISCADHKKFTLRDDNKIDQTQNDSFLTANIDGADYSFSDKVNLNSTAALSHIINGYNKELKTRITLGLNLDNQGTGTFELGNNIVLVYHASTIFHEKEIYYIWHAKESVIGSSGTITITKNNDTYIEGTFLFKGVGSTKVDTSVKTVTEGKFRVLKK